MCVLDKHTCVNRMCCLDVFYSNGVEDRFRTVAERLRVKETACRAVGRR